MYNYLYLPPNSRDGKFNVPFFTMIYTVRFLCSFVFHILSLPEREGGSIIRAEHLRSPPQKIKLLHKINTFESRFYANLRTHRGADIGGQKMKQSRRIFTKKEESFKKTLRGFFCQFSNHFHYLRESRAKNKDHKQILFRVVTLG